MDHLNISHGFTPIGGGGANCTFYEWSRNPSHAKFFRIFSIISVLTVLVVVVVLGNALVIAAVLLRRRLRSATGLLILSLSLADLLVGTVILPFSIANEVLDQYWIFGESWCTIWLTMDIWMCTASIYNLVAISIDRYIAIIKPLNYPMLVTKFRARCTVAVVWIGSFIICSPSFFLASSIKDKDTPCRCTPAHAGRTYVIFSASSSFYIPMIIVVFVYFRIYIAARAATKSIYSGMMSVTQAAKKNTNTKSYILSHPTALAKDSVPMLRVHRGSSVLQGKQKQQPAYRREDSVMSDSNDEMLKKKQRANYDNKSVNSIPVGTVEQTEPNSDASEESYINGSDNHKKEKEANGKEAKKSKMNPLKLIMRSRHKKKSAGAYEKRLSLEIKAAKTVAIVTGCFIFCWLGFALVYGLEIKLNDVVWSVVFWLGYLNSALNPVIYTVFNREFRICFKRLLTCHHLNHTTQKKYNNYSYNSTAIRSNNPTSGRTVNSPAHAIPQHQPHQPSPLVTDSPKTGTVARQSADSGKL